MSASKVFGIGLSRTGTASLTEALRVLGYHSVHFPLAILKRGRGGLELDARAAARFDALTDTPVARMYRELDAAFPGSKFILTTRDADEWARSMRRLRASYFFMRLSPKIARLTEDLYGPKAYADESALQERCARHQEAVLAYFGNRVGTDLLLYDVRDGWEPLAAFLGRQPAADTPFPHINRGYSTTLRNALDFAGYF